MARFGRKDLRENAFAHLTSNLFKVDVHVISFHVLRASRCLQTELLAKLFLHLILIKDVGENDLLVLWNVSDKNPRGREQQ